MKILTILAAFIVSIVLLSSASNITRDVSAQGKKPPETIVLGKEAKLRRSGMFSLVARVINMSLLRRSRIHVVAYCYKYFVPTGLAALFVTVIVCGITAIKSRASGSPFEPKLLPEIPQVKFEGSAEPTVMTNQQAFHRNCGGCHDEVVKARPNLDPAPPTSKKCTTCHKKAAA
ncbi:MAG: hypothetical protein DMF73_20160 [Acidobacteria bacterium]|nr:MAG: hypothetical protein DMF73_20160 [Acidobacteriota bacterium]